MTGVKNLMIDRETQKLIAELDNAIRERANLKAQYVETEEKIKLLIKNGSGIYDKLPFERAEVQARVIKSNIEIKRSLLVRLENQIDAIQEDIKLLQAKIERKRSKGSGNLFKSKGM